MFYRTIFLCLVGFVLVKFVKMDPLITFEIKSKQLNGSNRLHCDHSGEKIEDTHIYTVHEGGNFTILTKYDKAINHIICHARTDEKEPFAYIKETIGKKEITFRGERRMGTEWKCKILAHRDNAAMHPVVQYKNNSYSAAYCYMKIHVRQKEAPQSILVNNMEMQAVRTNLTVKDVDFIAEYQYVDGDEVKGICINQRKETKQGKTLKQHKMLSMEYMMAGTMSDASTMDDLKSSKMIGLSTRLQSGHNNSYMICTHEEKDDYTKVMVRFVERTKFNNIGIKINGMFLPPHLTNAKNNYYEIEYKYYVNQIINVKCDVKRLDVKFLVIADDFDKVSSYNKTDNIGITVNGMVLPPKLFKPESNSYRIDYKYVTDQKINVTCGIERTDVKLSVNDEDFVNKVHGYNKKDTDRNTAMMMFHLSRPDDKTLTCAIDYTNGTAAEQVRIHFTAGEFPTENCPLHMELPSNGRVMDLYNDYKLSVIFYEFKDGETLKLTCGHLCVFSPGSGPVLYLELDSEICETDGCPVSTTLNVTRDSETKPLSCFLKQPRDPNDPSQTRDIVHREIRVIFRERVLTTTTSTTTTSTTTTPTTTGTGLLAQGEIFTSTDSLDSKGAGESETRLDNNMMKLAIIAVCVVCIIIICASIVIVKLRKRNHSQGGPHNRNYENLQEPSEVSIPAYPPQWENNYAVPVDRRTEDTTYSVPCPPADLYATPIPKSLRNKKQKPLDPTYAVLAVPKNRDQKNMFQETEDPNYSEVYANRPEACYTKVLPKSQRNKVEQDNPYSYVTNDRPCAFTVDPEPMYCEPGKARDAEYANLNNSHYANSNAQEYVEPTYCEPQKLMK